VGVICAGLIEIHAVKDSDQLILILCTINFVIMFLLTQAIARNSPARLVRGR
jgi:hypothetical protein